MKSGLKRILSLFVSVVLCVLVFGAVEIVNADEVTTKKFEDIKDHWAKADIEKMAKKGVINGISDTEFAPDVNVSRAEFLALVVRAMGIQSTTYENAYSDINGSEWYAGTVQAGKNLGLIDASMTPDDQFKPTEPINREEMTSLIVRAYESKAKTSAPRADISVFDDVDEISSWAKKYVEGAYGLTIIKGVDVHTFSPKSTASRAQAATIISRFLSDSKIGKTLKILSIGNSYSMDSLHYFYPIAESYGYDGIVLGILHINSCSLSMHAENIETRSFAYTYYKNTADKWITTAEVPILRGITDEVWDYVVIGHSPMGAGEPETFSPYLKNIVNYVKENALNPKVKIGYNMTWAHQSDSTSPHFKTYYMSNQKDMYECIASATKSSATRAEGIDFIIPCGTAIQNARTGYVGDTLTRDGNHLSDYLGRYIAALTWYSVITGTSIEDVAYTPNAVVINEKAKALASESVKNAIKKPYVVTNSKITE